MLTDAQSLSVSTDNPAAIQAIDAFREAFLGYRSGADVILQAVEADPHCALAQVLCGALFLFLEDGTARERAFPYVQAARHLAGRADPREQMLIAAVDAWSQGNTGQAASLHRLLAEDYPRDLVSAKLGQYHYLNLGAPARMLEIAEKTFGSNKTVAYAYGMRAFALEQMDRLREAEVAGRQAISLLRDEPWAQHAVAHVMETQGRLTDGCDWLEQFAEGWTGLNSFMVSHNFWHLALFWLDRDAPDRVLALYDDHVWAHWKAYSQDQVNAISLLARLSIRGVDVGGRWRDVADHVLASTSKNGISLRLHEHVEPFLDLHYLYCLAKAGRRDETDEMLDSLRAHADQEAGRRPAWRTVALPLATGLVAHARDQWKAAAAAMQPALPDLQSIGGSHAQRDLFHQIHVHALLKAERFQDAKPMLEARLRDRPGVPSLHRQRASLLAGLGQIAAADGARAEASRLTRALRPTA